MVITVKINSKRKKALSVIIFAAMVGPEAHDTCACRLSFFSDEYENMKMQRRKTEETIEKKSEKKWRHASHVEDFIFQPLRR